MDAFLDWLRQRKMEGLAKSAPEETLQALARWYDEQEHLNRLLNSGARKETWLPLFLTQHAGIHSAWLAQGDSWSLEDLVLEGLSEAQVRARPAGQGNSIAWLVWHISRIEDVAANVLLAVGEQVLHSGQWEERLGVSKQDVGTGMVDEEVAQVSEQVDLIAMREYRAAVARSTEEIARAARPEELGQTINPDRIEKLRMERAVGDNAASLIDYWSKRKNRFFFYMPLGAHPFMHLVEALYSREKLRSQQ